MKTCPICRTNVVSSSEDHHTHIVNCPLCGHYRINYLCLDLPITVPTYILSGVTRNHWESFGKEFEILSDSISSLDSLKKLSSIPIPNETDIPAKADLILQYARRKSTYPGSVITLYSETDYSVGFCQKPSEFRFCLSYLLELKLIEFRKKTTGEGIHDYCITPKGWAYLSGIDADAKDQGFIAMAFRLPSSDVLHTDGLNPGITNAGYNPLRIDRKDHNNRIDDEIVAEIRKSKFVVADLTDKNAGAYFEAGFAMGLGKPVIWTCQQADIDKKGGIHFDTRQYSIVPWKIGKLDDFAKSLTQRIEATIGHGRYVPA